jgi:aryl-alcohol dehydrogenase-like predicted oxidoreductase
MSDDGRAKGRSLSGRDVPRVEISPGYSISRLICGGWQLAEGHNPRVVLEDSAEAILTSIEQGVDTFDCADIYTGVEALFGEIRPRIVKRYGAALARSVKVHTKFVPDLDRLATIDRDYVRSIIERSLTRLRVETLDLVQFHWWDFNIPGYVQTAQMLQELQAEGKIRLIGVTNFDTRHLSELLEAGVPVATHQLQYSLLDMRPENGMAALCEENGISMLCYGTLAGGFISDRFLGATHAPDPPENRSQTKYSLIIEEFGGWGAFQRFLETVRMVADKHGATIANVAEEYILSCPQVAAIIVGSQRPSHISENRRTFSVELDAEDLSTLRIARGSSSWRGGEVYDLERVPGGRHAAIMKYNLNQDAA